MEKTTKTIVFKDFEDYNKKASSHILKELEKLNAPENIDLEIIEDEEIDKTQDSLTCIKSKKHIVSFGGYSYNIGEKIMKFTNEIDEYKVVLQKDVLGSRIKLDK